MARSSKLKSELVVSLTDHVSGPAAGMERNLRNMEDGVRRQQQRMDAARGQMFDAAAVAYVAYRAFSAPIGAAVDFQAQLEGIRQKASLTRNELAELGREARDIGLATSQGAGAITGALDTLLGSGAVTPEQAIAVADALGKAASAYTASPTDLANATAALIGNMGIAADEMERTFDIMSQGGKEGKFELKDMAAEFPGITAAAKALGIQGTAGVADLVAALEVAASGAASGSEAANNMANFMRKVMAPDSIKKFGEAGIDIVEEMNRAVEAGVSPMEHALNIIGQLTEGGKQDLLGQYFADAQVQQFLLPLLQNMEEYRRIRQEAIDADGVVQADYQEWLTTPGGAIARFEASVENFNLAIGNSLLPKLIEFIEAITPMIDSVSRFVDANDKLVAAVLEMVAAILALRLAAAAAGFGGAFLGLGGKQGALSNGVAGGGNRSGAPGGGRNAGKGLGWWGFMGFNALEVAQDYLAAGEGIKTRPTGMSDEDWAAQVKPGADALAAQNAAIDKSLRDWEIGGFKPLQVVHDITSPVGGIGGVPDVGATQAQVDALKGEIAKLDAEIAEWPEQALEERRARLAEKLAGMEAELAASGAAIVSEFMSLLARMRAAASGGINIPIRTSQGRMPGDATKVPGMATGGWVDGYGSGTSDSVPRWLSDGEFVVNAAAAARYAPLLEAVNSGQSPGAFLGSGGSEITSGLSVQMGGVTFHVSISGAQDPRAIMEEFKQTADWHLQDVLRGMHVG